MKAGIKAVKKTQVKNRKIGCHNDQQFSRDVAGGFIAVQA